MRHAILLLAAFAFTSVAAGPVADMNEVLQRFPDSGQTLRLAAACEAAIADANRVAAATLDLPPCTQPHHVATA
jgi:hypothetical protein